MVIQSRAQSTAAQSMASPPGTEGDHNGDLAVEDVRSGPASALCHRVASEGASAAEDGTGGKLVIH